MTEGQHQTCWSIALDKDGLRAASDFLARDRAPKPATRRGSVALWLGSAAAAFLLSAAIWGQIPFRYGRKSR